MNTRLNALWTELYDLYEAHGSVDAWKAFNSRHKLTAYEAEEINRIWEGTLERY